MSTQKPARGGLEHVPVSDDHTSPKRFARIVQDPSRVIWWGLTGIFHSMLLCVLFLWVVLWTLLANQLLLQARFEGVVLAVLVALLPATFYLLHYRRRFTRLRGFRRGRPEIA